VGFAEDPAPPRSLATENAQVGSTLQEVPAEITMTDSTVKAITLKCRIDTEVEIDYIENGGVLHYVLRNLAKES
jgi:aconitase A